MSTRIRMKEDNLIQNNNLCICKINVIFTACIRHLIIITDDDYSSKLWIFIFIYTHNKTLILKLVNNNLCINRYIILTCLYIQYIHSVLHKKKVSFVHNVQSTLSLLVLISSKFKLWIFIAT